MAVRTLAAVGRRGSSDALPRSSRPGGHPRLGASAHCPHSSGTIQPCSNGLTGPVLHLDHAPRSWSVINFQPSALALSSPVADTVRRSSSSAPHYLVEPFSSQADVVQVKP